MRHIQTITILFVILIIGGCGASRISKYVSEDKQVQISMPYEEITNIPYNKKTEPYAVCLREKYTFLFKEVDMHWQHIEPRLYYANLFDVPKDSFKLISATDLKPEIEKLYAIQLPTKKGDREIAQAKKTDTLTVKLDQVFSDKKGYCTVTDTKGLKYLLKWIDATWKIISVSTIEKNPIYSELYDPLAKSSK